LGTQDIARKIDNKIKGNWIDSKSTLRVSQLYGMAANNTAAIKATFLLYLVSAIL
jgi:hypothetical protein